MPGVPGKTNNPNGRPSIEKALTVALRLRLHKTIDIDGKRISGEKVLADLATSVLTTGRLQFPGDVEASVVSVKDWLDFAKWAYQYLEPPVVRNEHGGPDGGDMIVNIRERNAITKP